jgi:spore germination protein GerM
MKKFVVVVIVIVCVIAAWLIWRRLAREPEVAQPVDVSLRTRIVTLYFGSRDARGLVSESRELRARDDAIGGLRGVVEALISGPQDGGVPTLPSATRLLGAYIADDTAYLDFSREIVDPSTGSTAGEYIMIASVVNTVCSNFSEVEAVKILIEGEEVDTLGGHLLISGPLKPSDWR